MTQSASWVAKTIHLMNENGANFPPPAMFCYWAISDLYEENMIKTNYVSFEEGNYGMLLRGNAAYANSWDIEKPVFQGYRLLHKLGAYEDSSYGGTTGDGVNIVATASNNANDSIQVLVYDHVASTSQSAAPTDNVTLNVTNIPWAPGQVKVEDFLVDTTHSNTYTKWVSLGKPATPTNAQWDSLRAAATLAHYDSVTTTTLTGTTYTKTFPLHYFSVMLLVLSNPNVQATIPTKSAAPVVMRAGIVGGRLMLTVPEQGLYKARLYSLNGRLVFEWNNYCTETAAVSLPGTLKGAFVLRCSGPTGSLVRPITLNLEDGLSGR